MSSSEATSWLRTRLDRIVDGDASARREMRRGLGETVESMKHWRAAVQIAAEARSLRDAERALASTPIHASVTAASSSVVDLAPLRAELPEDLVVDSLRDDVAGAVVAIARALRPELVRELEKEAQEKRGGDGDEDVEEDTDGGGGAAGSGGVIRPDTSAAVSRVPQKDFALLSSTSLSLSIVEALRADNPKLFSIAAASLIDVLSMVDISGESKVSKKMLSSMSSSALRAVAEGKDSDPEGFRHGQLLQVAVAMAEGGLAKALQYVNTMVEDGAEEGLPKSAARLLVRGGEPCSIPVSHSRAKAVVEAGFAVGILNKDGSVGMTAAAGSGKECHVWRLTSPSPGRSSTSTWSFSGSPKNDSVSVKVSKGVELLGFDLFGGSTTYRRKIEVHEGDGSGDRQYTSTPLGSGEGTVNTGGTTETRRIDFDKPVRLEAEKWYTLVQKTWGPATGYSGTGGAASRTDEDSGVVFSFRDARGETNGTSTSGGQISGIHFRAGPPPVPGARSIEDDDASRALLAPGLDASAGLGTPLAVDGIDTKTDGIVTGETKVEPNDKFVSIAVGGTTLYSVVSDGVVLRSVPLESIGCDASSFVGSDKVSSWACDHISAKKSDGKKANVSDADGLRGGLTAADASALQDRAAASKAAAAFPPGTRCGGLAHLGSSLYMRVLGQANVAVVDPSTAGISTTCALAATYNGTAVDFTRNTGLTTDGLALYVPGYAGIQPVLAVFIVTTPSTPSLRVIHVLPFALPAALVAADAAIATRASAAGAELPSVRSLDDAMDSLTIATDGTRVVGVDRRAQLLHDDPESPIIPAAGGWVEVDPKDPSPMRLILSQQLVKEDDDGEEGGGEGSGEEDGDSSKEVELHAVPAAEAGVDAIVYDDRSGLVYGLRANGEVRVLLSGRVPAGVTASRKTMLAGPATDADLAAVSRPGGVVDRALRSSSLTSPRSLSLSLLARLEAAASVAAGGVDATEVVPRVTALRVGAAGSGALRRGGLALNLTSAALKSLSSLLATAVAKRDVALTSRVLGLVRAHIAATAKLQVGSARDLFWQDGWQSPSAKPALRAWADEVRASLSTLASLEDASRAKAWISSDGVTAEQVLVIAEVAARTLYGASSLFFPDPFLLAKELARAIHVAAKTLSTGASLAPGTRAAVAYATDAVAKNPAMLLAIANAAGILATSGDDSSEDAAQRVAQGIEDEESKEDGAEESKDDGDDEEAGEGGVHSDDGTAVGHVGSDLLSATLSYVEHTESVNGTSSSPDAPDGIPLWVSLTQTGLASAVGASKDGTPLPHALSRPGEMMVSVVSAAMRIFHSITESPASSGGDGAEGGGGALGAAGGVTRSSSTVEIANARSRRAFAAGRTVLAVALAAAESAVALGGAALGTSGPSFVQAMTECASAGSAAARVVYDTEAAAVAAADSGVLGRCSRLAALMVGEMIGIAALPRVEKRVAEIASSPALSGGFLTADKLTAPEVIAVANSAESKKLKTASKAFRRQATKSLDIILARGEDKQPEFLAASAMAAAAMHHAGLDAEVIEHINFCAENPKKKPDLSRTAGFIWAHCLTQFRDAITARANVADALEAAAKRVAAAARGDLESGDEGDDASSLGDTPVVASSDPAEEAKAFMCRRVERRAQMLCTTAPAYSAFAAGAASSPKDSDALARAAIDAVKSVCFNSWGLDSLDDSDPVVERVRDLCNERARAAETRATGLTLAKGALEAAREARSAARQVETLQLITAAMRQTHAAALEAAASGMRADAATSTIAMDQDGSALDDEAAAEARRVVALPGAAVHPLAGLEGAGEEASSAVMEAAGKLFAVIAEVASDADAESAREVAEEGVMVGGHRDKATARRPSAAAPTPRTSLPPAPHTTTTAATSAPTGDIMVEPIRPSRRRRRPRLSSGSTSSDSSSDSDLSDTDISDSTEDSDDSSYHGGDRAASDGYALRGMGMLFRRSSGSTVAHSVAPERTEATEADVARSALLCLAQDYSPKDAKLLRTIKLVSLLDKVLTGGRDAAPRLAPVDEDEDADEAVRGGAESGSGDASVPMPGSLKGLDRASSTVDDDATRRITRARLAPLVPVAEAIMRVLTARIVGLEGSTADGAVLEASRKDDFRDELASAAGAALRASLDALSVAIAEDERADTSAPGDAESKEADEAIDAAAAALATDSSSDPSIPRALVPSDEAIPTFLPGGRRMIADAPTGKHFALSMWMFPPKATQAEQGALSSEPLLRSLPPMGAGTEKTAAKGPGAGAGGGGAGPSGPGRFAGWNRDRFSGVEATLEIPLTSVQFEASTVRGSVAVESERVARGSGDGAVRMDIGLRSGVMEWGWKFTEDSSGDECATAGIAPETFTQSGYSSSSAEFRSLRFFSGRWYVRGSTVGGAGDPTKVHPDESFSFRMIIPPSGTGSVQVHTDRQSAGEWVDLDVDVPTDAPWYPMWGSYGRGRGELEWIKIAPGSEIVGSPGAIAASRVMGGTESAGLSDIADAGLAGILAEHAAPGDEDALAAVAADDFFSTDFAAALRGAPTAVDVLSDQERLRARVAADASTGDAEALLLASRGGDLDLLDDDMEDEEEEEDEEGKEEDEDDVEDGASSVISGAAGGGGAAEIVDLGPRSISMSFNRSSARGSHSFSGDGSIHFSSNGAVLGSRGVTSGLLRTVFSTSGHSRRNEQVVLGASPRDIGSDRYSNSSCRGVGLRAYNGWIYVRGSHNGGESSYRYHPGDKVAIEIDMNDGSRPGTVRARIRPSDREGRTGGTVVELFTGVPVGEAWYPLAMAYGSCDVRVEYTEEVGAPSGFCDETGGGGSAASGGAGAGGRRAVESTLDASTRLGSCTVESPSTIAFRGYGGVVTTPRISSGVLEATITTSGHRRGNEYAAVGVSTAPLGSPNYDNTSSRAFVVRGFNGNYYRQGSTRPATDATPTSTTVFHPDENVTVRLDMGSGSGSGSLSFTTPRGTALLDRDIPAGSYGIALMGYGTCTCRIVSTTMDSTAASASGASMAAVGAVGLGAPVPFVPEWDSSSAQSTSVSGMSISMSGSNAGCRLTTGVSRGLLRFTFDTSNHSSGNEMITMGVAPRDFGTPRYDNTSFRGYLLRAYNGQLYRRGSSASTDAAHRYHPGERCAIEIDMNDGSRPGRAILRLRPSDPQGRTGGTEVVLCDTLDVGTEWFPIAVGYGTVTVTAVAGEIVSPDPPTMPKMRRRPALLDPGSRVGTTSAVVSGDAFRLPGTSGRAGVRATTGATTGVLHCVWIGRALSSGNETVAVGFSPESLVTENYNDSSCAAMVLRRSNGEFYRMGARSRTGTPAARRVGSGDRIALTLDLGDGSRPGVMSLRTGFTDAKGLEGGTVHMLAADIPTGAKYFPAVMLSAGSEAQLETVLVGKLDDAEAMAARAARRAAIVQRSRVMAAQFVGAGAHMELAGRSGRALKGIEAFPIEWNVIGPEAVPGAALADAAVTALVPFAGTELRKKTSTAKEGGGAASGAGEGRAPGSAAAAAAAAESGDDVDDGGGGGAAGGGTVSAPSGPARTLQALQQVGPGPVVASVTKDALSSGVGTWELVVVGDDAEAETVSVGVQGSDGRLALIRVADGAVTHGEPIAAHLADGRADAIHKANLGPPPMGVTARGAHLRRIRLLLSSNTTESGESTGEAELSYSVEGMDAGVVLRDIKLPARPIVVMFGGATSAPVARPTVLAAAAARASAAASLVRGGSASPGRAGGMTRGGVLWSKGHALPLLAPALRASPMARMCGRLTNSRQIVYEATYVPGGASRGRSAVCFQLVSRRAVPADRWSHVAFVQDASYARIFINGDMVAARPLPLELRWAPEGSSEREEIEADVAMASRLADEAAAADASKTDGKEKDGAAGGGAVGTRGGAEKNPDDDTAGVDDKNPGAAGGGGSGSGESGGASGATADLTIATPTPLHPGARILRPVVMRGAARLKIEFSSGTKLHAPYSFMRVLRGDGSNDEDYIGARMLCTDAGSEANAAVLSSPLIVQGARCTLLFECASDAPEGQAFGAAVHITAEASDTTTKVGAGLMATSSAGEEPPLTKGRRGRKGRRSRHSNSGDTKRAGGQVVDLRAPRLLPFPIGNHPAQFEPSSFQLTGPVGIPLTTTGFPYLGAATGRWYFEVLVHSAVGGVRVGVATDGFKSEHRSGGPTAAALRGTPVATTGTDTGVGEDEFSWAYETTESTSAKLHNGERDAWGVPISSGSVLMVCIDLDKGEVSYGRDGKVAAPLGVAFSHLEPDGKVFPTISLSMGAKVQLLFGGKAGLPIRFSPPTGFVPLGVLADGEGDASDAAAVLAMVDTAPTRAESSPGMARLAVRHASFVPSRILVTGGRHAESSADATNGDVFLLQPSPEGRDATPEAVTSRSNVKTAWLPVPGMLTPRFAHAAVVTPTGSQVIVAGGKASLMDNLKSAEMLTFSPETGEPAGTWVPLPDMSRARAFPAMAMLPDGRVLIAGGHDGRTFLNSCEILSADRRSWSKAPAMSRNRSGATASTLPDGRVVVMGGFSGTPPRLSDAEVFDPASGKWSLFPTSSGRGGKKVVGGGEFSSGRSSSASVTLGDGSVLIFGGKNDKKASSASVDELCCEGSAGIDAHWRRLTGRLPTPRRGLSAASFGIDTAVIIGGVEAEEAAPKGDVRIVRRIGAAATLQWAASEALPSLPTGRDSAAAVSLPPSAAAGIRSNASGEWEVHGTRGISVVTPASANAMNPITSVCAGRQAGLSNVAGAVVSGTAAYETRVQVPTRLLGRVGMAVEVGWGVVGAEWGAGDPPSDTSVAWMVRPYAGEVRHAGRARNVAPTRSSSGPDASGTDSDLGEATTTITVRCELNTETATATFFLDGSQVASMGADDGIGAAVGAAALAKARSGGLGGLVPLVAIPAGAHAALRFGNGHGMLSAEPSAGIEEYGTRFARFKLRDDDEESSIGADLAPSAKGEGDGEESSTKPTTSRYAPVANAAPLVLGEASVTGARAFAVSPDAAEVRGAVAWVSGVQLLAQKSLDTSQVRDLALDEDPLSPMEKLRLTNAGARQRPDLALALQALARLAAAAKTSSGATLVASRHVLAALLAMFRGPFLPLQLASANVLAEVLPHIAPEVADAAVIDAVLSTGSSSFGGVVRARSARVRALRELQRNVRDGTEPAGALFAEYLLDAAARGLGSAGAFGSTSPLAFFARGEAWRSIEVLRVLVSGWNPSDQKAREHATALSKGVAAHLSQTLGESAIRAATLGDAVAAARSQAAMAVLSGPLRSTFYAGAPVDIRGSIDSPLAGRRSIVLHVDADAPAPEAAAAAVASSVAPGLWPHVSVVVPDSSLDDACAITEVDAKSVDDPTAFTTKDLEGTISLAFSSGTQHRFAGWIRANLNEDDLLPATGSDALQAAVSAAARDSGFLAAAFDAAALILSTRSNAPIFGSDASIAGATAMSGAVVKGGVGAGGGYVEGRGWVSAPAPALRWRAVKSKLKVPAARGDDDVWTGVVRVSGAAVIALRPRVVLGEIGNVTVVLTDPDTDLVRWSSGPIGSDAAAAARTTPCVMVAGPTVKVAVSGGARRACTITFECLVPRTTASSDEIARAVGGEFDGMDEDGDEEEAQKVEEVEEPSKGDLALTLARAYTACALDRIQSAGKLSALELRSCGAAKIVPILVNTAAGTNGMWEALTGSAQGVGVGAASDTDTDADADSMFTIGTLKRRGTVAEAERRFGLLADLAQSSHHASSTPAAPVSIVSPPESSEDESSSGGAGAAAGSGDASGGGEEKKEVEEEEEVVISEPAPLASFRSDDDGDDGSGGGAAGGLHPLESLLSRAASHEEEEEEEVAPTKPGDTKGPTSRFALPGVDPMSVADGDKEPIPGRPMELEVGTVVCRGPHFEAEHGDEDGGPGNLGVVVDAVTKDSGDTTRVRWFSGGETEGCRYSTGMWDLVAVAPPGFPAPDTIDARPSELPVGTRVVRDKDFSWGEQDRNGDVGKVTSLGRTGSWISVTWEGGHSNSYRYGEEGKWDLMVVGHEDGIPADNEAATARGSLLGAAAAVAPTRPTGPKLETNTYEGKRHPLLRMGDRKVMEMFEEAGAAKAGKADKPRRLGVEGFGGRGVGVLYGHALALESLSAQAALLGFAQAVGTRDDARVDIDATPLMRLLEQAYAAALRELASQRASLPAPDASAPGSTPILETAAVAEVMGEDVDTVLGRVRESVSAARTGPGIARHLVWMISATLKKADWTRHGELTKDDVASACWMLGICADAVASLEVGSRGGTALAEALLSPMVLDRLTKMVKAELAADSCVGEDDDSKRVHARVVFARLANMAAVLGSRFDLGHSPAFLCGKGVLGVVYALGATAQEAATTLIKAGKPNPRGGGLRSMPPSAQATAGMAAAIASAIRALEPHVVVATFATRLVALRRKAAAKIKKRDPARRRGSTLARAPSDPSRGSTSTAYADADARVLFAEDGVTAVLSSTGGAVELPSADPLPEVPGEPLPAPPAVPGPWSIGAIAVGSKSLPSAGSGVVRFEVLRAAREMPPAVGIVARVAEDVYAPVVVWRAGRVTVLDASTYVPGQSAPAARTAVLATRIATAPTGQSRLRAHDTISISLNVSEGLIHLFRNDEPLIRPVMAAESGAGKPICDSPSWLFAEGGDGKRTRFPLFPAIWLAQPLDSVRIVGTGPVSELGISGDRARVKASSSGVGGSSGGVSLGRAASTTLAGRGTGLALTHLPSFSVAGRLLTPVRELPWFDDLCRLDALARELARGSVPHSYLRRELPAVAASRLARLVETKHPSSSGKGVWERDVRVPGASAVRILFDSSSRLEHGDRLLMESVQAGVGTSEIGSSSSGSAGGALSGAGARPGLSAAAAAAGGGSASTSSAGSGDGRGGRRLLDAVFGKGGGGTSRGFSASPRDLLSFDGDVEGHGIVGRARATVDLTEESLTVTEGDPLSTNEVVRSLRDAAIAGGIPRGVVLRGDRVRLTAALAHASEEELAALSAKRGAEWGGGAEEEEKEGEDEDEDETALGALLGRAATGGGEDVAALPTAADAGPPRVTKVTEVEATLSWTRSRPATPKPSPGARVSYRVFTSAAPGSSRTWIDCGTTNKSDKVKVYALKPGQPFAFRVAPEWDSAPVGVDAAGEEATATTSAACLRLMCAADGAEDTTEFELVDGGATIRFGKSPGWRCFAAPWAVRPGTGATLTMNIADASSDGMEGLVGWCFPTSPSPFDGSGRVLGYGGTTGRVWDNYEVASSGGVKITKGSLVSTIIGVDGGSRKGSFTVDGLVQAPTTPGMPATPAVPIVRPNFCNAAHEVNVVEFEHDALPTLDSDAAGVFAIDDSYLTAVALSEEGTADLGDTGGEAGYGLRAVLVPEFAPDVVDLALAEDFLEEVEDGVRFGGGGRRKKAESLPAPGALRRVESAESREPTAARLGVQVLRDVYMSTAEGLTHGWPGLPADIQLVQFVDEIWREASRKPKLHSCTWEDLIRAHKDGVVESPHPHPHPKALERYPLLKDVPPLQMRARFEVLQAFNKLAKNLLPWVDLSRSREPGSPGHVLAAAAELLFLEIKQSPWQTALSTTTHSSSDKVSIQFDMLKEQENIAKGLKDTEARWSSLAKAMRGLSSLTPKTMRRSSDLWTVSFARVHSIDAGGPTREAYSIIARDLELGGLDIVRPTPNNESHTGEGQDLHTVNPGATGREQMRLLAFLGQMMGVAIRTKSYMRFMLAPLVWKGLCGGVPSEGDLAAQDRKEYLRLTRIRDGRTPSGVELTPERFSEMYGGTRFVVTRGDGEEVELCVGGGEMKVTWENKERFAELALNYRLRKEGAPQIAAIRQGLETIVPGRMLALFGWEQLRLMVAGSPYYSIPLWKKLTSCEFTSDPDYEWMWEILDEWQESGRVSDVAQWCRFWCGLSTLPLSETEASSRFTLSRASGGDETLPHAGTCGHYINLPRYSSKEKLEQIMRICISSLSSIED